VEGSGAAIFPDGAQIATVDAAIQLARPCCADVTVVGPGQHGVTMDVTLEPNTAAAQAEVEAEVEAMLVREAEPGGTVENSKWRGAISASALEDYHALTDLDGDGTGLGDVDSPAGQVAYLDTINFASFP